MTDHLSRVLTVLGVAPTRILRGVEGAAWYTHSEDPGKLPSYRRVCVYRATPKVSVVLVKQNDVWYARDDTVHADILCSSSRADFEKLLPVVVQLTHFPYPPLPKELFKFYWQNLAIGKGTHFL